MSIRPVNPNTGRPGQPLGYYNEDSKDHGEQYHTAEKALRVRAKWKTVLGITLAFIALTSMSTFIITAMVAKWSGWFDLPSLSQITEYWGWDYNGDYEAVSKQDIVDTILSYIPEWVPHAYGQVDYNRAYFNATLTLDGEIDEDQVLTLVTGPGTCKSYIYGDPPVQYLTGRTLDDSVDVDNFNSTFYYEPGSIQAGEPFFFYISEQRNDTSYACTETLNHVGKQQEHVTAILPSQVEQDVWKHDSEYDGHEDRVDDDYNEQEGHVYLLYNKHAGEVPKEFE